jgi:serine/threonine protein kinase
MNAAVKVCPQCGTEYPANARFCEIDGTALRGAAAGSDLVGAIVADRYHVLKKLGEGGMGQVYLVEHVKMGRKSALKVMHPGMVKDIDAISRFNREAANASRIAHPNVAAVYDFGETPDGIIYLAMEFVDGPPLKTVIEQAGALAPKRAADIVRQTADALAVAHDMGIVHRDLKPDNIMVAKTRDGADLVKVVDFGIAKAAGNEAQKVTKTGLVVGTPEYMSPEQLSGDKLDGRSDIYSLGLVAFNMLTGMLPFPSDSAQEAMIMRLTDLPKRLSEMRPEVAWPDDVQAVMDKALERDASIRYQNATEFGRDLVRAIDRMPETQAAEMRTQLMGVPATRVGASSPADVPAPTAAVAGQISGAPVTQAAAPQRPKSKVPLYAGAGVLIVAAAIAIPMAMRNGVPKTDTSKTDTSKGVATAPVRDTTPQPTAGTSTKSDSKTSPTTDPTKGPAVVPFGKSNASKGAASVNVEQTLTRLEADVRDSTKADANLAAVEKLWPQLKNSDDQARANYVRYWAALNKNDGDKACTYIRDAAQLATDPSRKDKYQGIFKALYGCS